MRFSNCSSRLVVPALALAAVLGIAASAQAQTTVCLVAKPFTAAGAAAGVPMWGYAEAPWTGTACTWGSAGTASSPGPRITLVPEDTSLTIHLKNELPVPTSIVIPGLPSADATASRVNGRASSFTAEVLPLATGSYSWNGVVRPGTFMYQSGSHVQVQIQMGLYGAVTKDFAAGQAYAGKAYAGEVVLFYSEIDPTLHQTVAAGAYGGLLKVPPPSGADPAPPMPTMTSTYNYKPRYFLVNGDAYPGPSTAVTAGGTGTTTLIRFLNAGLRTHVPTLLNGDFELVAEDAHPYGYSRRQVQVSLLAGKTMDVLWTPTYAGSYPIFDRAPHLTTNGGGPGGMIASLTVGGTITALDDAYGARNDRPLVVAAPGVMGNDSTITTAAIVANVPAGEGSVVLNPDGSFTYDPQTYTGITKFTYQQPASNVATVTITSAPNAVPEATPGSATTNEDTAVLITLVASDPNSDPITYNVLAPPAHGTLVPTSFANKFTYTPAANYNGPDSFTFTASDGLLTSAAATVSIAVTPVNDAPVATPASWPTAEDTPVAITLSGSDIDGNPLTFRITTNPANGALSGLNAATGLVTYTPNANYFGTDSFRFVVNDGTVDSPVATISLPVSAVLDNPIAANDSYTTKYNASLTMNVLANDRDPDGTPLTIVGTFPKCFNSTTGAPSSPCNNNTKGVDKVTINNTRTRLTFVPNAAVLTGRPISFQYQARDSGGALSANATVAVTVLPK